MTVDECLELLQHMKKEDGGDTVIGTATDVTDELYFFDTKIRGLDGRWKHKKAIQYDIKFVSSEMVLDDGEKS